MDQEKTIQQEIIHQSKQKEIDYSGPLTIEELEEIFLENFQGLKL